MKNNIPANAVITGMTITITDLYDDGSVISSATAEWDARVKTAPWPEGANLTTWGQAIGYILRAEKASWNDISGSSFHDLRHNVAWDKLDAPITVKNRHAIITIDDREINDRMITIDNRHYVPHN